jgi:hypothetical protein
MDGDAAPFGDPSDETSRGVQCFVPNEGQDVDDAEARVDAGVRADVERCHGAFDHAGDGSFHRASFVAVRQDGPVVVGIAVDVEKRCVVPGDVRDLLGVSSFRDVRDRAKGHVP